VTKDNTLHPYQGEDALEPAPGIPLFQVEALMTEYSLDDISPPSQMEMGESRLMASEAVPLGFRYVR
jgi:hypothetical protein